MVRTRVQRATTAVVTLVALSGFTILGTGCGKSNSSLVKDVQLSTHQEESGDLYILMSVLLDTGNLQMPAVTVPINEYGDVSLIPGSAGTELVVDANFTQITQLPTGAALLPNGNPIPVAGAQSAAVMNVPIGGSGSVYVGLGEHAAFLGAALRIDEFSQLGVGNFNVFIPFNFAGGVYGTAGVYTGGPGQSGIAVFVDLAELLESEGLAVQNKTVIASSAASSLSLLRTSSSKRTHSVAKSKDFGYLKQGYSRSDRRKKRSMDRRLYRMNRKRQQLHSNGSR